MTACHRWEIVSTLGFEWEVFTGRRPWKWSFAVYLLTRFLALISVTLNLVGANLSTISRYNCNVSGRSGVPSIRVLTSRILRRLGGVWSLQRHGFLRLSPRPFSRFGGKWSIVARVHAEIVRLTFHPNPVSRFGVETQLSHRLPY